MPQSRSRTPCSHKRRPHRNGAIARGGRVPPRQAQHTWAAIWRALPVETCTMALSTRAKPRAFEGVACKSVVRSPSDRSIDAAPKRASTQAQLVGGSSGPSRPDRPTQLGTVVAGHHLHRDRARGDLGDRDDGDIARNCGRRTSAFRRQVALRTPICAVTLVGHRCHGSPSHRKG